MAGFSVLRPVCVGLVSSALYSTRNFSAPLNDGHHRSAREFDRKMYPKSGPDLIICGTTDMRWEVIAKQ